MYLKIKRSRSNSKKYTSKGKGKHMKREELIAEMAKLKIGEPIEEQIRDHILQIVGNDESMCSIVLQDVIVSPSLLKDINRHLMEEGRKRKKGNSFCFTMEEAEREREEKTELLAENVELSRKAESAEKAEKEKEDALARMTAAQQAETQAKEALKKAKEAEKAAKDALAEAKANPEIPEAKRKEISEKAAAEAKAEAAKAVADAEQKLKRANAELTAAQQQLKMTNPDVAEFGVYFRQVQEDFNRLCGKLIMIRNTDEETGNKCTQAIKAAVQKFMENLPGGNKE